MQRSHSTFGLSCSIVAIIVFGGCSTRKIPIRRACIEEARMADVFMAIDAKPIKKEQSESSYAYHSMLSMTKLIELYHTQMDAFGWHLLAYTEEVPALLVFEKPAKICIVSLQRSGKRARIRITYLSRQLSNTT